MQRRSSAGLILGVIVFVVVIIGGFFMVRGLRRVDPGEVGVIVDYGHATGGIEGQPRIRTAPVAQFFFIDPVTERLAKYPAQQQTLKLEAIVENNNIVGGDAAKCSDRDGIPLWINGTVLWRVNPEEAGLLYLLRPGYALDKDNDENEADDNDIEQTVVLELLNGAFSTACGEFGYTEIFGAQRTNFGNRIAEIMDDKLSGSHLIMDAFVLGEINSTSEIESGLRTKATAQESAAAAESKAEEQRNLAEGAADAARTEAAGARDAAIEAATGRARAIEIEAAAQADAIRKLAEALAASGMTLRDWEWLQQWDGELPITYVQGNDGNGPFMTIDIQPTETP